jgi:hypothetical protein
MGAMVEPGQAIVAQLQFNLQEMGQYHRRASMPEAR